MTRRLARRTMLNIIAAVAREADLPAEMVVGRNRHERFQEPRRIAMLRCREAGFSLPQIAQAFDGRDHKTVLATIRHAKRIGLQ